MTRFPAGSTPPYHEHRGCVIQGLASAAFHCTRLTVYSPIPQTCSSAPWAMRPTRDLHYEQCLSGTLRSFSPFIALGPQGHHVGSWLCSAEAAIRPHVVPCPSPKRWSRGAHRAQPAATLRSAPTPVLCLAGLC